MPVTPELEFSKVRIEALSDAVFAIVMTLLVIEIKIPEVHGNITSTVLLDELKHTIPLLSSYFLTFAVLSALWLSHHFLFHTIAKNIDRSLVQLNVIFLSFVSLIPFSSHFLGTYFQNEIAIVIFGLNTLAAYISMYLMRIYALKTPHIENGELTTRIIKQGKVRTIVNLSCTILGVIFGFFNTWIGIIFLLIPVMFNVIPGSLNKLERIFGFELK